MSPSQNAARRRREKVAQMQAAQRRRQRRNNLITAIVAVVVIGALAGGAAFAIMRQGPQQESAITGVQTFEGLTANHVEGTVNYPQTPPAGGDHASQWLNCGIYDEPVPNENAVHSLEHGAVWITYQPNLPADQVEILQDLVDGERYGILSPFEGLPSPIAASAWGQQLTVTSASDARLESFIEEFAQSPDAPEPGALCTGGVGEPTN